VFRGPGGAAHQLGAQHSQCLEYMYANCPGLKVVMPSTPADAKGLLKTAIRDDDPIVFIEGELLYSVQGEVPEGEHLVPLGRGDVKRAGTDATVVTWGRMLHIVMDAAELLAKEGISVEIVDPRTVRPLDEELIFESVRKTNRAVVVEEAHGFSAVGAEVVARIQRACFDDLDAPVERVHRLDVPMPYALNLEDLVVPTKEMVAAAVRRAMYVEAA
jgi:pyruvate dehydrogenase E1 component beta subunit